MVDPNLGQLLSDEANAVRFEVITALTNQRRVVPIRVQGAEPLGAQHLSGALSLLANANSPAIRPDTAVADVNRIVEVLTGYAPGAVRVADRWDAIVCGGLAAIAVLAWASYGRRVLNLAETWLWASAVILPCLSWWHGRRLLRFPASATGTSAVRYGVVRSLVIEKASQARMWGMVALRLYRLPHLPGETGYLRCPVRGRSGRPCAARLDRTTRRRTPKAGRLASVDSHEHALATAALPRRVSDDGVARRLAAELGASVVIWGRARTTGDSVVASTVHVEFVDRPGMIRHGGDVVEETGRLAGPEHLEIASNVASLQTLLPRLLVAYDVYRDAADSLRASGLTDLISATLANASDHVASDGVAQRATTARSARQASLLDGDDDAVRSVSAMLHFLRGNVHVRFGEDSAARADFEAAITATASRELASRPPTYVEALNNLVLLDILAARYDSGWARLQTGIGACPVLAQPTSTGPDGAAACSYLAYHKGWLLQRSRKYAQADTALWAVRPGQGVEDVLLAKTHQALAYGAVRQAADSTASPARIDSLLSRAERDARAAMSIIGRAVADSTALRSIAGPWRITGARISLARREWSVALDTLRHVLATVPDDSASRARYSPAFLLAAAATKCLSLTNRADSSEAVTYLGNFVSAHGDFAELAEYNRITARCTSAAH
ncbi:MAG: hypothetical protein U0132_02260 [Gemmatimonadaceae bacterium]